ncbi:MAG TPA: fimbrial assembly protein [Cellulomonas sp.]
MSTISLTKPKTALVTNVWPQVDLLPPEVRAGRKLAQTKRLLVIAILGVVLISALGWVYALFTLRDANTEVANAQADTDRLTSAQAQYAEVPQIQSELSKTQSALDQATATEVLWKPYLEALRAVTPAQVSYDTLQVTVSNDPNAAASGDPLQAPSVGQLVFTGRSATVTDMSAWMDAVRSIPGLSDPWFTQASLTDDNGTAYYQVSGTVQIGTTALAHRFASAPDTAGGSGGSTAGTPSAQPTDSTTGGNS